MNYPLYQVDAFSSALFSGNPAAVCILDRWLEDSLLQAIAAENHLSETAFLVRNVKGYDLRWFTPVREVALCGHATLASAFVLFECLKWPSPTISFQTRKSGKLSVTRRDSLLEMDFPAVTPMPVSPPRGLLEALGTSSKEVFSAGPDLMVVLPDGEQVKGLRPDMRTLSEVQCRGTIITAKGDHSDFVSRFFAPRFGVPEDPVTGSAHCALTPYWSKVLKKNYLHARQVSMRGGELFCQEAGDRVRIAGNAVLYMEGTVTL